MKIANLKDMVKGWFIGNFEPSLLMTNDCEVAVKYYKKGDSEIAHFHIRQGFNERRGIWGRGHCRHGA